VVVTDSSLCVDIDALPSSSTRAGTARPRSSQPTARWLQRSPITMPYHLNVAKESVGSEPIGPEAAEPGSRAADLPPRFPHAPPLGHWSPL